MRKLHIVVFVVLVTLVPTASGGTGAPVPADRTGSGALACYACLVGAFASYVVSPPASGWAFGACGGACAL